MTEPQLTAEELKIFQEFYHARVSEAGGARHDAQELELARDILLAVINDGLTPTPDGGVSYVRRGAMDWTDPATLQAAQLASGGDRGRGSRRPRRGADVLQGLAIIGLALLAAVWFLWPTGEDEPDTSEVELATQAGSDSAVTPTPLPTLEADLLADIVEASGVKTALVVPRTLEVKGVSFVVQPVQITAGDWPLPDDERAVSWVYGTVINYVFGLETTPDSKALLASLEAGDEFLLRMSTGPAYRFAFADIIRVAPQASEIFRQTQPGLTLVLMNDEAQPARVIIRARFIPESELGLGPAETGETAELGQALRLNEAVKVTGLSRRILAQSGAPAGSVYVAVEYRLEHTGPAPAFETRTLSHHLEAAGGSYPPVPVPPDDKTLSTLPARLQPGQMVTTTAVYAVPEPALAQLVWSIAPEPAGTKMRITLPPLTGSFRPRVAIKEARRLADTLHLVLELEAAGQAFEVTAADIELEGGRLSPVGNVFPWAVPATGVGKFNLLLTPDGRGQVTLTLLEQGFELTY